MIECGVGVIVVCLPTLKHLLRTFYHKMSSSNIFTRIKSTSAKLSLLSSSGAGTEPDTHRLDSLDRPAKWGSSRTNLWGQDKGTVPTLAVRSHDLER